MWLSQRFQGLNSALIPVYALSSLLAAPAVSATNVYHIEANCVQRAYSASLFGLRAVSSQYASLLGMG